MLTQDRLILTPDRPCRARAEWGYCLYAGLLREAPSGFGREVHQDRATPVSQFLIQDGPDLVWTVNLLGEESERKLSGCLDQIGELQVDRENLRLRVTGRERTRIGDVEELLTLAADCPSAHRLRFCTPTAFKSQGKYRNLPTERLIIQSLLKNWNGCITECPIEDGDGAGLETLAAGLECREFHLHSRNYHMKKTVIPGFCGELVLENHLTGFHRQLANALLLFSGYAGVGIKTALGMGGVIHL